MIGVLIILIVVAVVVLLHSRKFHDYILAVAQQKASASLGTQVTARDFALHFSGISPTLELYDAVVHGAPPYGNVPLLSVQHVQVAVKITSLLRRTWYLQEIRVDHPVVRLIVDQNGKNNLPTPETSGQSQTNVFDLGISHAVLNNGEAYYNDQKSDMYADLHDLEFQSRFSTSAQEYAGMFGYGNGRLVVGKYKPIPHGLTAEFSATRDKFNLRNAVLTSGSSRVVVNAAVENYSQPSLQANYQARLATGEFRHILNDPTLPVGVIQLNGTAKYQSVPNEPMLKTATLSGALFSPGLAVNGPSFRGDVRDLRAHYSLADGNAEVTNIHGLVLGGVLSGNALVLKVTGNQRAQMNLQLRGVNLADLKSAAPSAGIQDVGVTGIANLDVSAGWVGSAKNLVANVSGNTQGSAKPSGVAQAVPLSGNFSAQYSAANDRVTFRPTNVRAAGGSLNLSGGLGGGQTMQVHMNAINLQALENLVPASSAESLKSLGLQGIASFNGTVSGTTTAPNVNGRLVVRQLGFKGSKWQSLSANVKASPSGVNISSGQLQSPTNGNVAFDVSAGLRKWKLEPSSPLNVTLHASRMNVANLLRAAGTQVPATGVLNANVTLHGSQLNPVGQGTVRLTNAVISDQPVQLVTLTFQGTGNEVHGDATVQLPAGGARLVFSYLPKDQGYNMQLTADGIHLDQLQAVKAKKLQVQGVLNLNASGQGTIQNPGLTATAQIPKLILRGQAINGTNVDLRVANHVANFTLGSEAVNTQLRANGTVNLTGDYNVNATLDTQAIPLQPLLAMYSPAQAANITGQTELHAAINGPLKNKTLLNARVTIPTLRVNYKNTVEIGAVSPIHIDYTNGVLQLQRATIRGTGTDLQVQGTVPVTTNAPISLLLLGTVDLQLAQLANPDITSSGQLKFDINSYGQPSDPNVKGHVQIVNANIAMADVPLGLQSGNGVLTLTKDRLNIAQFQGLVGGGQVTARGGIVYRPSMQFDLAFGGKGMRFIYPDGVRQGVDAKLSLTGTTQDAQLNGQVQLNELSFTSDFDVMKIMGQFSGETVPPPSQGLAQNTKLNIGVQSTGGLNATSRTLSLQANANLRVSGTAAQPVVLGRMNVTGGDLIFLGNRYVLQGGTLDFVNPTETQPVVNMNVATTIQQYNINMHFWGPANNLHTNYSSDPALPPSDIINLVAFGKTQEASAANPTPGNLGAQSLIASQVSSQVTSRISKIAGISQLSVDPVLGGTQQNLGARVTIQQRVTGNLFITFSSDVTSIQRQEVLVQYKVSPRITIIGSRDQNGGFGFDTRFQSSW